MKLELPPALDGLFGVLIVVAIVAFTLAAIGYMPALLRSFASLVSRGQARPPTPPATPVRKLFVFTAGMLAGIVLAVAFTNRYTVTAVGAGSSVPVIHAYRLDRWTGQVIGIGGFGKVEATSIPGWNDDRTP